MSYQKGQTFIKITFNLCTDVLNASYFGWLLLNIFKNQSATTRSLAFGNKVAALLAFKSRFIDFTPSI